MARLASLACLGLIFVASALAVVDPRGARPVEHGTRSEKCASQKEWPFCTDVEWGPKCPSGCRMQGLLDKADHDLLRKIEKIRAFLDQNRVKHRSTDEVSKQTYDYLKDKLTVDSGHDNSYFDLAQNLRRRITDMKIKIDRQLRILAALKDRVKDQVVEMQRLEVDIDIKLRSCKGSCEGYAEHQVDQESYVALEKQVNQLDSHQPQTIESVGTLYVMKSRPMKDVLVDSVFKSRDVAGQQTQDMFPEVNTHQLILEQEGSSTSPATISKDPGTSYAASTSSTGFSSGPSTSSSASSTSSRSITEIGGTGTGTGTGTGDGSLFGTGGGFGTFNHPPTTTHVSSQSVSCTRRTRTFIVHTKDGPVERTEEVMEGGPECQSLGSDSHGGMGAFFPTLTHGSSSSSSSSSRVVHSGGTKGSLLADTKSGFGNPFGMDPLDLGAFRTDAADDDLPDIHARGLHTTRVERQADYVGKVCLSTVCARLQRDQDGRQPPTHTRTYRRRRCQAKSAVSLCSDDDWVSKCPSGCRLQGLISQTENEVEKKLWKVCQRAKTYQDAAERSMSAMTHIYNNNRRVIVNTYMSELKLVEHAEGLSRNLTLLRKRSSRLSEQLEELRRKAQKQVEDLYRTEVDVDMKLRSCYGSCRWVLPFSVDHPGYQTLQADVDQLDETLAKRRKAATPAEDIPNVKLQPVDVGPAPSPEYKTIPTVQRELLTQFEDIGQNHIMLEELLEESADVQ